MQHVKVNTLHHNTIHHRSNGQVSTTAPTHRRHNTPIPITPAMHIRLQQMDPRSQCSLMHTVCLFPILHRATHTLTPIHSLRHLPLDNALQLLVSTAERERFAALATTTHLTVDAKIVCASTNIVSSIRYPPRPLSFLPPQSTVQTLALLQPANLIAPAKMDSSSSQCCTVLMDNH
jgi:hypothetical protein